MPFYPALLMSHVAFAMSMSLRVWLLANKCVCMHVTHMFYYV